ncbi:MAG TPA: hypothetical protein VE988_08385 [Gemmataceae bacterium]|nr:hypothetical protein [Gemmataceae bacterium]
MRKPIEVENIEELRHQEGIDDVALWQEIAGLHPGDFVKLTLVTQTKAFETVTVRITSVRGSAYRGKLVNTPACAGLAELKTGSALAFTASQIHSVVHEATVQGP